MAVDKEFDYLMGLGGATDIQPRPQPTVEPAESLSVNIQPSDDPEFDSLMEIGQPAIPSPPISPIAPKTEFEPVKTLAQSVIQSLASKPAMALRGATTFTPGEGLGLDRLMNKTSSFLESLRNPVVKGEIEKKAAGKLWPVQEGDPWYKVSPEAMPETINAWAANFGDQIPLMLMTIAGRVMGKVVGKPVGAGAAALTALATGGPDPTDIATTPIIASATSKVIEHLGGAAPLIAIEAGNFMDNASQTGIDRDIAEKYARTYAVGSGAIEYAQTLWNLKAFKRLSAPVQEKIIGRVLLELGGNLFQGVEEFSQEGLQNHFIGKAIDEMKARDPYFAAKKPDLFQGAGRAFAIGTGISVITRGLGHASQVVRSPLTKEQNQQLEDATENIIATEPTREVAEPTEIAPEQAQIEAIPPKEAPEAITKPPKAVEGEIAPELKDQQEALNTFQESIEKAYKKELVKTEEGTPAQFRATERPTGETAQAATAAEKAADLFNKKIVWFENTDPSRIGIHGNVTEDTILLDVNSKKPFASTVVHEVMHSMEKSDPKLYQKFLDVIQEEGSGFDEYKAGLLEAYKAQGLEVDETTDDWVWRELVSEVMDERGTDPAFWRNLYERSPEAVQKFIDAVTEIIETITGTKIEDVEIQKFFNDFSKVRDTASDVVAEFAKKKTVERVEVAPEIKEEQALPPKEEKEVSAPPAKEKAPATTILPAAEPAKKKLKAKAGEITTIGEAVRDLGGIRPYKDGVFKEELKAVPATYRTQKGQEGKPLDLMLETLRSKYPGFIEFDATESDLIELLTKRQVPAAEMQRAEERYYADLAEGQETLARTPENPLTLEDGELEAYETEDNVWHVRKRGGKTWLDLDPANPTHTEVIEAIRDKITPEEDLPFSISREFMASLDELDQPPEKKKLMREHKWSKRAKTDQRFRDDVRKIFSENMYPVEKMDETLTKATEYIDNVGIEEASDSFINDKTGLTGETKAATGIALIHIYHDLKATPAIIDKIQKLTDKLNQIGNESGKSVNIFKLWSKNLSTPEGAMRRMETALEEGNKAKAGQSQALVEATPKAMDDVSRQLAETTLKNKELQERLHAIEEKATREAITAKKLMQQTLATRTKRIKHKELIEQWKNLPQQPETKALLDGLLKKGKKPALAVERKPAEAAPRKLTDDEFGAVVAEVVSEIAKVQSEKRKKVDWNTFERDLQKKLDKKYGSIVTDESVYIYESAWKFIDAQLTAVETVGKSAIGKPAQAIERTVQTSLELWARSQGLTAETGQQAWQVAKKQADAELSKLDLIAWAKESGASPRAIKALDHVKWRALDAAKIADLLSPTASRRTLTETQKRRVEAGAIRRTGLISWQLRQMGQTVRQVVLQHYTEREATRKALTEALMIKGIPETDAKRLAARIREEFNRQVDQKAIQMLDKAFAEKNISKRSLKDTRAITELLNLLKAGALTTERYKDAFAKQYGLTVMNEAIANQLRKLSKGIQEAPAGFQRDDATRKILSYIAKRSGIRASEKFWSLWYSSLLSGYQTHQRNIISTAFNSTADTFLDMSRQPKNAAQVIMRLPHSIHKGVIEFISQIRTGGTTLRGEKKFAEVPQVLEMNPFKSPFRFLSSMKYVMRFMIAEDMLFFKSAQEAHAIMVASDIAREEGLLGRALTKRVSEILHADAQTTQEYRAQAVKEGLKGLDIKRRVFELAEQNRPSGIQEQSIDFGKRATFNYQAEGYLGIIGNFIKNLSKPVPTIRFLVPFTNIVANVANISLDYTPMGFYRVHRGMKQREGGYRKFSEATGEKARQTAKAVLGTLAMVAVYALDKEYEDEDEPTFRLHGPGPADYKRRNEMRETGWIPYSVQMKGKYYSYLYTPMAIPFSIVGNYRDAQRYSKMDDEEMVTRLGFALMQPAATISDMSFFSGVSSLFEILSEKEPVQKGRMAERFFARIVTSGIPNLARQVYRVFDPTLYDTKGIQQAFMREIPGVNRIALKPRLNMLGEVIKPQRPILLGKKIDHPIWEMLVNKEISISIPRRTTEIAGVQLTDDEYYEYIKISGKLIKAQLQENLQELNKMDDEVAKKAVQGIVKRSRYAAKGKIYEAR